MKSYEIEWKDFGAKVYGKTLDELFDETIKEFSFTKDAWDMINFMAVYLGTKGAPTIDAGIFLKKFADAVSDGRIEWKER